MLQEKRLLNIFISSQSDVDAERRRAVFVVSELGHAFARFFAVVPGLCGLYQRDVRLVKTVQTVAGAS